MVSDEAAKLVVAQFPEPRKRKEQRVRSLCHVPAGELKAGFCEVIPNVVLNAGDALHQDPTQPLSGLLALLSRNTRVQFINLS
jgi:aspartate carbamoyltransferase catalytic subunit